MLGMVFPYGLECEVARGGGRDSAVSITELGVFTRDEAESAEWMP